MRQVALDSGATPLDDARAVDVERAGDRVTGVVFQRRGERFVVGCRRLVVADGARSRLGRVLGREWHRDTAYGVAIRAYVRSGRSSDPWIASHLEPARRARRPAQRVRLGVPAGRRRGERRRRHAGHRPAPGRRPAAPAARRVRAAASRGVGPRRRGAGGVERAAAHGRRGERRGRAQLGSRRRRRRVREPAQRRGHRLRPRDRPDARRACWSAATTSTRRGPRCCAVTWVSRSPSPVGSPGCSPCPVCCLRRGRSACARGRS
nr:hypothetical protein [Angustibacter aerolatus]